MKNVFITGAAGFIGTYAVRLFRNRGWHVIALVHRKISPDLEALEKIGAVTILRGDVADSSALLQSLVSVSNAIGAGLDAIVHCAGRASDIGWRSGFRRTNFESVRGLVHIAREMNIGRFVFVSTTDVYGLSDFNGEAEDELPLRARPANPYPEFKIAAEKFIRSELPKDRFCIVRPAQVWGIGDQTLTSRIVGFLRWSPWIVHFGRWRGQNRWPMAHVENVAAAIYLAASHPDAAGIAINVVDDERTTMDEFYRIIARLYLPERKFGRMIIPLWIGQCIGAVVSGFSNLFNMNRPFADPSFYAVHAVSHNLDFSNRRMKELFAKAGIPLKTREQGIQAIAENHYHSRT